MKRQVSTLLYLILALALSACGAARQPSWLPDPEEVKALLVQLVDVERRAPGIVVGMIAADPEERWVVGYGRLSADDERVPDGDTVFELASVGKVFAGTLLAQAAVQGEVQLDAPISMYLPEGVTAPEYQGRPITLLDLATHTSGLSWGGIEPKHSSYTLDQMYAHLSGFRLTRAPGSQYEYSGFGFGLLGNLLVRRAGVADYEALLEERITGPLGMDSTHIGLTPDMRSRLAPPHETYSRPAPSLDAPTFAGAGAGLRSTANDMLTFLAANMGLIGTELQPALQMASSPQRPIEGRGSIGLGWHIPGESFLIGDRRFVIPDTGIRAHNGGNPGYHIYLAWDSQRKIGVVVLANVAVSIDDVGLQLMGTRDLFFSNLIFVLTAIAFMLLLAVLLAAQEKRRVKTTWVVGALWLLLAVPFALLFSRFLGEGRGDWTLLPLSLVLLYMFVKALDFVFKIDFRRYRMTRLATLTLMCLALFSLIWIAFSIHPFWAIPVLIAFGILAVSLIFTYRDRIRIQK